MLSVFCFLLCDYDYYDYCLLKPGCKKTRPEVRANIIIKVHKIKLPGDWRLATATATATAWFSAIFSSLLRSVPFYSGQQCDAARRASFMCHINIAATRVVARFLARKNLALALPFYCLSYTLKHTQQHTQTERARAIRGHDFCHSISFGSVSPFLCQQPATPEIC